MGPAVVSYTVSAGDSARRTGAITIIGMAGSKLKGETSVRVKQE